VALGQLILEIHYDSGRPGTLGRIMNVTGDPIDERGPIKHTKKLSNPR